MRRNDILVALMLVCVGCTANGSSQTAELENTDPRPQDTELPLDENEQGADGDEPRDRPPVAFPKVLETSLLVDENAALDVVEVQLSAGYADVELADGYVLRMMAYNGSVPGPLLTAQVGDEVIVHFTNNLDEPTTVHWHGLRIAAEMDGTPRVQDPVKPGETFTYRFTVPDAGTFWYHPHVRSNEQVEKGLYGTIVVRDRHDPEYDAERMLVLDDALLDPEEPGFLPFMAGHGEAVHGRNGNVLLINGAAVDDTLRAPVKSGSIERWRLVNTANARTMYLTVDGAHFQVIGTDGGLLREPYETDQLLMPVGQRYDISVSFDRPGQARLISHVLGVNEEGEVEAVPISVYGVEVEGPEASPHHIAWPKFPARSVREAIQRVEIAFDGVSGPDGIQWRLNGQASPEEPLFTFTEGETVEITLKNKGGPEHPFHLHGQFFEIIDTGKPWTDQPGLKDTVLVPGQESVKIIAYFDNPGRWMAHCHILEHAELGMMSEIVVDTARAAQLRGRAPTFRRPGT